MIPDKFVSGQNDDIESKTKRKEFIRQVSLMGQGPIAENRVPKSKK